jgi:hypothetical protein
MDRELRSRLQDVREGKVELIDLDDVDAYVARQIAAVRQSRHQGRC